MKRRGLLAGLLFAPAIIRTPGLLMPVRRPIVTADLFSMMAEMLFRDYAIMQNMLTADLGTFGTCVYRTDETGALSRISPPRLVLPET